MANVKITELTALTTPADADSMVIVDASEATLEQTKLITFANLKLALTGIGATYGITGAYTASMPTNGVAASSIIMLGTSSTIIWMYLNAAPPGWKVLSTGADSVLGVAGGSAAFNVNGGNPDSAAAWAITGLTHSHTHAGPSHTHTGPSHTHTGGAHAHLISGAWVVANDGAGLGISGTTESGGTSATTSASGTGNTGASGTASTGDASVAGVSSTGAWRPKASVGKLFQLDTA